MGKVKEYMKIVRIYKSLCPECKEKLIQLGLEAKEGEEDVK